MKLQNLIQPNPEPEWSPELTDEQKLLKSIHYHIETCGVDSIRIMGKYSRQDLKVHEYYVNGDGEFVVEVEEI